METITHKRFLHLAIPFALSTVTQPLLGAVDTAVVGRLDSPAFIGGVAIGTVIFNTMYWLFGFLRVATSGFAAQSLGINGERDTVCSWMRPLIIATIIGLLFVVLQQAIFGGAAQLYSKAEPAVLLYAGAYFHILIWGAPFVLISYVNLGWLMGRGHVKEVVILQVGTNIANILLDIFFVLILHLDVKGVATATLISQAASLFLGLYLISRKLPLSIIKTHLSAVFETKAMKKLFAVNNDFFIRTVCLLTMTNIFVARGSSMGAEILAANAILFQVQYLIAYLFDGLANAVSVFAGKFVGCGDKSQFMRTRSIAHTHLIILSLLLIGMLCLLHKPLFLLFTDIKPVLLLCYSHMFYLILFIFSMALGLVYAGFYIGATCSAPIRNSLLLALAFFIPLELLLIPRFHNNGLWIAFIVFCLARSLVLVLSWNKLIKQSFNKQPVSQ